MWKIAGVQMDCRLADKAANLDAIRARLREAHAGGAQLVVFPECVLTGYCFMRLESNGVSRATARSTSCIPGSSQGS